MEQINLDTLEDILCCLMVDYDKNKDDIRSLIKQAAPDLNRDVWKRILYADCMSGKPDARNHRFSLFVMTYEASEILRSDDSFAYDAFMEAYRESSNIYKQLQDTPFDIRGFLARMQAAVPVAAKLDDNSRECYDSLAVNFKVYRGLSKAEKDEGNIGVSWTVDAAYAANYLRLKDNEVKGDVGYVAEMTINKSDVIAVLYEYHSDICYYEVITLKNDGIVFREVKLK